MKVKQHNIGTNKNTNKIRIIDQHKKWIMKNWKNGNWNISGIPKRILKKTSEKDEIHTSGFNNSRESNSVTEWMLQKAEIPKSHNLNLNLEVYFFTPPTFHHPLIDYLCVTNKLNT